MASAHKLELSTPVSFTAPDHEIVLSVCSTQVSALTLGLPEMLASPALQLALKEEL